MSKQTFKIGKNFIPNILVLSSSAVLVLFAALILIAPVTETTSAVDTPNLTDGLSLVTNKTIEANIHPEENGSLSIIKDTIVGNTNSPYGYEIYISANSDTENSIYLNGNPENIETTQKITATTGTYNAPVALDLTNGATWGYAIAGLDNFDASYNIYTPSATAKFAAMPTVDNKQLIRSSGTAVSDDTIDIYYGINADSTLEPGIYKTEILYTALPIIPPSTAKAILGDNGNLNFVYDYSTYTVGETYEDNIGNTEIVAVYDVPADSSVAIITANLSAGVEIDYNNSNIPQWAENSAVTSANFDISFANFRPNSTAYWFGQMTELGSVTNAENLNTSFVTDMTGMFLSTGYNVATFTINDIENWDTSNVITMEGLFTLAGYSATTWNVGDLSGWDTSSVKNLSRAFGFTGANASSWSIGNLGYVDEEHPGWNVDNVENMRTMFQYTARIADTFDIGDIGSWNVSKVTDMSGMFNQAGRESTTWHIGDISGWNVSNVTTMSTMFQRTGGNATTWDIGDLSGWDVSKVTSTYCMFNAAGYGATTWNIGNLGYVDEEHPGWNVSSVEDMSYMFHRSGLASNTWYIGDIGSWNVSNVTAMHGMFDSAARDAATFNPGDLSGWNVSKVSDMGEMFNLAGLNADDWNIGDISGWDVTSVTDHSDFIDFNTNSTNASVVNNQPNWQ